MSHLLAEVRLLERLERRLARDGLHAVPDAQLQVEHEVVAAVPLVDGLPQPVRVLRVVAGAMTHMHQRLF